MATKFAKVLPLADPSARADSVLVERAFREALGSMVTADAHDLALALSLERAGLTKLPCTNRDIAAFLDGPFRTSVEQLFGASVARVVVGEARILTAFVGARRASGARPREPEVVEENVTVRPESDPLGRETIRVPHTLTPTPIVAVTDDRAVFDAITREVGNKGAVLMAHNLTPFLTALHSDGLDPLLVIDARSPSIRMKLSDFARRVPETSQVVYWGDDRDLLQVLPDPKSRESWVAIEVDAEEADVVAIVAVLAGAR
jgi:hypothetical protein